MSNLIVDFGLRLLKIAAATVIGLIVYAILTGPVGAPGSLELALLSWLAGAAALLLVESSPI
jgi:hypothetical protein